MQTGGAAPRRRRRLLAWALLALVPLLLVLAVVMGLQAFSAYRHLDSASAAVPVLREQLTSGDVAAARDTADEFADDTSSARGSVHGPHWWLAARIPGLGPNVEAVQTVTTSVDDLARDAVPRLLDAAGVIDPASFSPQNGRVDLEPLTRAAPDVAAADATVQDAVDRIRAIETEELTGRLRTPVEELQTTIGEVGSLTGTAAKAAELIPPMLGADGPRHYLLLAQNNAEPRSLGGITGAVIHIRAQQGKIRIVDHRSSGDFESYEEPVLPLTDTETSLYGTQAGRFIQNATSIPDFPRAAEVARAIWRENGGRRVDGVASVDPVALQMLVAATGEIRLAGGRVLDGENTARLLLNEVYRDLPDPAAQDAFFAVAAAAVFEKVMSGGGDLPAVTSAITEATARGRVMLWSAHEEEQSVLSGTTVAGELQGERDGSPVVGVYVHDRATAKIAFYESVEVEARPADCESDSGDLAVTVTVTHDPPRRVRQLPDYILGGARRPGWVATQVYLYAPAGGIISDFRSSDGDDSVVTQIHEDLHVASREVNLAPGDTATLDYRIRMPESSAEDLSVRLTPGPSEDQFSSSTRNCG